VVVNQHKQPLRGLRSIPQDTWDAFEQATDRLGTDRSTVVHAFIRWWLGKEDADLPQRTLPSPPDNPPPVAGMSWREQVMDGLPAELTHAITTVLDELHDEIARGSLSTLLKGVTRDALFALDRCLAQDPAYPRTLSHARELLTQCLHHALPEMVIGPQRRKHPAGQAVAQLRQRARDQQGDLASWPPPVRGDAANQPATFLVDGAPR
jgi:hypothetical protein